MATERDFLLPDLGEGLTEGEIVRWLVAVGDVVEVDQPVAEIETAKAVVEVPSPFAGHVTALHAEEGEEVEVGKPLITIAVEVPAPEGDAGTVTEDAAVGDMVPEKEDAAGDGASGSVLVGYGTGSSRVRRRRGKAADTGPAGAGHATARPGRPLAKPPVRKLAKDLGIDLSVIEGSGPEGVITREDVEAYAARAGDGAGVQVPRQPAAALAGGEERIPLRGIRKRIAEKMAMSRREIPDATTWVDCDATALWELRAELNRIQDDVRVSPLAIVLRAVVAGIRRFPDLNARLDTEAGEIVLQRFVHLGIAADTGRGLVVPVIRDAHRHTTLELAAELNRLATAARDGTVTPAELSGGTFTVSNYGSFGVDGGSAVINHPEAAILGVGRIADRPWVHDGALTVRKVMQLSIAFDHRICDGAEAAGFLRFVADCIENPARLLADL